MKTVAVVAWAMILGGTGAGVLSVLALMGLAIGGRASVQEPPYLKAVLFASMSGCGCVVALGRALRNRKAWAWDATMVLLATAAMVAGFRPF